MIKSKKGDTVGVAPLRKDGITYTDDLAAEIDRGGQMDTILLDFAKALNNTRQRRTDGHNPVRLCQSLK